MRHQSRNLKRVHFQNKKIKLVDKIEVESTQLIKHFYNLSITVHSTNIQLQPTKAWKIYKETNFSGPV